MIFAAAAAPAYAQVFKWVDERGITHYGERPPQGAKASEVPDKLASPPPGRAAARPPEKDQPPAAPASPQSPSPGVAPAAKAPLSLQEEQAAERKAACDRERAALARLKAGTTTSYSINEKGEKVIFDNSAAIGEQEKRVGAQCGA